MLQNFETWFLQFCRSFFEWGYDSSTFIAGLIPLAAITILLLAMQFLRQNKNPIYGVFGLFFGLLTYNYCTEVGRNRIIMRIDQFLVALNTPDFNRAPIPGFEFLFRTFVAPYQTRFVYEELIALFLLIYGCSWAYWVYIDYKKTGILFEDLSLKSLFKKKHLRPNRSRTNELGSGDLAESEHLLRWTKHSDQPDLDTCLYVSDLRGSEGMVFKAN
ncbi:MAG: hypothetical protein GYA55_11410, partial [SAR324 cluster bacterium]|nr:hypothetical protein [SAR324 cluster bacterium]